MNLRDIKKDIEYVISAFLDDCSVFATVKPGVADKELDDLLDEAIDLYNDLRDRANTVPEGGKRAYFNEIRKDLLEKTDALYDKLSQLIKAAK